MKTYTANLTAEKTPALQPLLRQIVDMAGDNLTYWAVQPMGREDAEMSGVTGEVVLDECVDKARYVLLRIDDGSASAEARVSLSPREQEIVRLVTKGYVNKTIASILEISQWTVNTHLRRIFAKLGVNSRAEMVATVLRLGLVME